MSTAGVRAAAPTGDGPCELCGGPTLVQKTLVRRVITLEHGAFQAHETVRICGIRCSHPSGVLSTRRSETLAGKVPPGAVYGYDLEVHVGLERFIHHRQRKEIRARLQTECGISLSSGEVSHLAIRFLGHLEELHRLRAPQLRQALDQDGGYPMHVDATGEDGRGTLFGAYAGSRQWVLGSWKIATECSELILPRLSETSTLFGAPMAIMRDFGRAVTLACQTLVEQLGGSIPVLGCHFHFLRVVGKDLQSEGHDQLRELFRRFGTRTALRTLVRDLRRRLQGQLPGLLGQMVEWTETEADHVLPDGPQGLATVRALAQWALDFKVDARYSFPFELPYLAFYQRCQQVRRAVGAYLRNPPEDGRVVAALGRLARVLDPISAEIPFERIARRLSARAALFGRLREALRIRLDGGPATPLLSPQHAAAELRDIKAAIDALALSLQKERPERGPAQDTRQAIDLILAHLDRHGDSLWGHVIPLSPEAGGGVRVVDRTNMIQERFWHQLKHGERRRSGRKVLTYDFEGLPAAATLACNLQHEDYVAIVCGTLDRLPQTFADLDQARQRRDLATPPSAANTEPSTQAARSDDSEEVDVKDLLTASLPREDRRFIRDSKLGEKIRTAARSRATRCLPGGSAR